MATAAATAARPDAEPISVCSAAGTGSTKLLAIAATRVRRRNEVVCMACNATMELLWMVAAAGYQRKVAPISGPLKLTLWIALPDFMS